MKQLHLSIACLLSFLLPACSGLAVPSTLAAPSAPTIPLFPTLPPTWTPAPSDTPAPATLTITPRPSATSLPATATVPSLGGDVPSGTDSILPPPAFITAVPEPPDLTDWLQIFSQGATFWLPSTFIISETVGLEGVVAIDESRQAEASLVLEPRQAGSTLESQMALVIAGFTGQLTVKRYEILIGGAYVSGRAFVETVDAESGEIESQVVYVFLHGDRTWNVTYSTEAARFEEWLPVFERSGRSFLAQP